MILSPTFRSTEIRIVDDNPVTVVLKDVSDALGYRDAHRMKRTIKDKYCVTHKVGDATGRPNKMICVTRPGLTQALATLRPQDTEKAELIEQFQDWMYEDVMESVYDTGGYHVGQSGDGAPSGDLTTLDLAEQMLKTMREQQERLRDVEQKQEETTQRLDDVEQTLEEHRAAPDAPTTRFGHEVQEHTWEGMRKSINQVVRRRQQRIGGSYEDLYLKLYDACQRQYGFHPKRVQRQHGGQSGIKALDFSQMRALLQVTRWMYEEEHLV